MTRFRIGFLFALVLFAASSAADARTLVMESFHSDIEVLENGALEVTETLHPRFQGQWNGIYRTIPTEYRNQYGFGHSYRLQVVSVTDGNGRPLKHKVTRQRHYKKIKIWVPGALDTTKTVKLAYHVERAMRHFDEHDELYWNVTGDEWAIPMEQVSATIHLPEQVTGLRSTAFTGLYGSREQSAEIVTEGKTLTITSTRPFKIKEGLSVVIGWDPGVVHRPGPLEKSWWFLLGNLMFLLPVGVGLLMHRIWKAKGKDPSQLPISAQYDPPLSLRPAELGTLFDGVPHSHDITATFVDLAVRGFLTIEEEEKGFFGLGSEYIFHIQPHSESELRGYEKKIISALRRAGGGEIVKTADLKNEFYKDLPAIKDDLLDTMVDRGYYSKRPDKALGQSVGFAILAMISLVVGGIMLTKALELAPQTTVISLVITGIILFTYAALMPRRTILGTRALEEVLGFEEFLGRVEGDHYTRIVLKPEMFEEYLPYAMALKVEDRWAKAFEGIYNSQPDWYRSTGSTGFHPTLFSSSLNNMASSTATAMASSPRSSSGSGFGGGGFSGGGGGGGGGGGF